MLDGVFNAEAPRRERILLWWARTGLANAQSPRAPATRPGGWMAGNDLSRLREQTTEAVRTFFHSGNPDRHSVEPNMDRSGNGGVMDLKPREPSLEFPL